VLGTAADTIGVGTTVGTMAADIAADATGSVRGLG